MNKITLYNTAKRYIEIIERIEHTMDQVHLMELEEERVRLHNKLLEIFKREGIPFKDREHVTHLALHIVRGLE